MAIYASVANTFRGEYQTHGGAGYVEYGGSGTTFIEAPNSEGTIESSLYIDNQGAEPLSQFISDNTKDSARTYIITSDEETADDLIFDHAYITGVGHLALRNTTEVDVGVQIKNLHGDLTGMIHTSVHQHLSIEDSDSPMPASFRVYLKTTVKLPNGMKVLI